MAVVVVVEAVVGIGSEASDDVVEAVVSTAIDASDVEVVDAIIVDDVTVGGGDDAIIVVDVTVGGDDDAIIVDDVIAVGVGVYLGALLHLLSKQLPSTIT